jgi:O-antigen/teichoic acid export membrane protein
MISAMAQAQVIGRRLLASSLARGTFGTFGLKVASIGLTALTVVLLARLLGAAGYGAYTYAMAWITLLNVPAILGMDTLLVRNIAAYRTQSAWGLMRGLISKANQASLASSLMICALAAAISWLLAARLKPDVLLVFWLALALLPLWSISRLIQSVMQGLQEIVLGQLPEAVIRPALVALLVIGAGLALGPGLNAAVAVALNIAAALIALLIGAWLLYKKLPAVIGQTEPQYQTGAWARSGSTLLLISSMQVVNAQADTIMLGSLKGPVEAGIYHVASNGAMLVAFVLMSVNTTLGPMIASLWAVRDRARLQQVISKAARVTFAVSLIIWLAFMIAGRWLLAFLGPEFVKRLLISGSTCDPTCLRLNCQLR